MRTYIYLDERAQVTRTEGPLPHNNRLEFRFDGTRITLATFESGRCMYVKPKYEHFQELVKLYHQHEQPEEPDDEYFRMVVDYEGRARRFIKYSQVDPTGYGHHVMEYYDDDISRGEELLLQADLMGDLIFARPGEPLWIMQYLIAHAQLWFNE